VIPPRQYVGFDAYKKDWQDFFALFPGPVDKFEITVSMAIPSSSASQKGIVKMASHGFRNTQSFQMASALTLRDKIRLRAYELYLERGQADGRGREDWLQAERELTHTKRTEATLVEE